MRKFVTFRLVSAIQRTESGGLFEIYRDHCDFLGYNKYFNLFEEELVICFGLPGTTATRQVKPLVDGLADCAIST